MPSNQHPEDTDANSFRNLEYPLDWDYIFDYVGFPAFFKPFSGTLVMMLQEAVEFTDYFRCYCLDRRDVRIMQYDPKQPHHLRYVKDPKPVEAKLLKKIKQGVLRINNALGYDFNTVEFAVREGVPYAIDFGNPAPDADIHSVGEDNFEWVVDAAAEMAIRRAKKHVKGQNNLTWGDFVASFVNGQKIKSNSEINK